MISIQHENKLIVVGAFAEFELADYQRFEQEVARQLDEQGKPVPGCEGSGKK